jgi:hypothetical protein
MAAWPQVPVRGWPRCAEWLRPDGAEQSSMLGRSGEDVAVAGERLDRNKVEGRDWSGAERPE